MASMTTASPIKPRDDSFSSYLNLVRESLSSEPGYSSRTHSSFPINSSRRRSDDGEIGIFSAEKYFNGVMDGDTDIVSEKASKTQSKMEGRYSVKSRSKVGGTVSSEASGNSRTGLLWQHDRKRRLNQRRFLGVFPCACSGKSAVDTERDAGSNNSSLTDERKKMEDRRSVSDLRLERLGLGFREGLLAFPPKLNGIGEEEKVVEGSKMTIDSSILTALTLVNKASSGGEGSASGGGGVDNNDVRDDNDDEDLGSESSSDLFEIKSLSVKSHPFFEPDGIETTVYEPSEASIQWSVVTASAANFSVASKSDQHAKKTMKQQRAGLLMGCVSHKSVNVTPNAHRHKLPDRANPNKQMPIDLEGPVTPAMRYHMEGLKKVEPGPVFQHRLVAPAVALSRVQTRQPVYMH